MYIYTLHYEDTKLYNRAIFVMPNDESAIKAMKLNLIDKTSPQSERFRDEVRLGNVELIRLAEFSEENGLIENGYSNEKVCNLKELLDDNNGNLETAKPDNT